MAWLLSFLVSASTTHAEFPPAAGVSRIIFFQHLPEADVERK